MITDQGVKLSVNIACEGPGTRRHDVLANGWFMDEVTYGVSDIASNGDIADENLTNASREEDN